MATLKELYKEYNPLYEELSDVTQRTTYWGYSKLFTGEVEKEYTRKLMNDLCRKLDEIKELAHELHDHLAWDIEKNY